MAICASCSFRNTFVIWFTLPGPREYESNCRMINELESILMKAVVTNRSTIPACDWRNRGKPWRISVTTAGVLAIQTNHPQDTSIKHYGYPSLLDYKDAGLNSNCVLSHTVPHPRGFSEGPVWPRVMVAPLVSAPGRGQKCAAPALTFCSPFLFLYRVLHSMERLWNRFRCKRHFI
jgi:hypothetical protein